jgi:cell division protein FtsB
MIAGGDGSGVWRRHWDDGGGRARPLVRFLSRCVAALVVLAATAAGLAGLSGPLHQRELLRLEIQAMEQERDRAATERGRAAKEVWLLENDPGFQALAARDRLDLYRKGETIFRR